mmetsp:Transcript_717/g.1582  ORF Transcript_717/g.1582 Transcript_717/m.1582 type:complete len:968 (+) Transcript_717:148-3051(+)|eukprot:CAMPEP_0115196588 /NCGR_PEP_ID=MMETSP0270-20121206/15163_1 /TAXON_ID=71861 /ORGANISM="Scrippsiella trochoidea, Strain CCMP3099" /LENGTH=967 /DNA_ID=CAMNT_0002609925 /DNA_START=148 /DNA_END=3051 /DNA_ORIENTATION=+
MATSEKKEEVKNAADIVKPDGKGGAIVDVDCAQPQGLVGFKGYFVLSFLANGIVSAAAIALWSSMGIGDTMYKLLQDGYDYKIYPFGVSFFIIIVMYLMDLFLPPTASWQTNQRCLASIGGRILLGIAGFFFLISCFLLQKRYPSVPLILNIFCCPLAGVFVRSITRPQETVESQSNDIVQNGDIDTKMKLLTNITGLEKDVINFYNATCSAFMTSAIVCLIVWLIWAVGLGQGLDHMSGLSSEEKDELYMLWVAPLVVAVSNFVFSLFLLIRIFMQRTYVGTDTARNRLIADALGSKMNQDMMKHKMIVMRARLSTCTLDEDESAQQAASMRYMELSVQSIRALSMLVKVVICLFILLLGFLYMAVQLLYAESQIASMVLGLLGAFFVVFVIFTYLSFRRIVRALGKWIADLPAWKAARSLSTNDWVRAFFFGPLMPAIPFVLVLSVTNQLVRKARGIYNREDMRGVDGPAAENATEEGKDDPKVPRTTAAAVQDPGKLVLTPRVHIALQAARSWDWLAIAFKSYVLCLVFVGYNLTPPLLNVGLAWMRTALSTWPFAVIVLMTFFIGVLAFLCPVVPGMTIYIFGGLVIANTCPPVGTDEGFWMGCLVNIILCWFLKLVACAIQQKCIGELLGKKLWVRQQVGVHKFAIKCIESILSKKGWTVGKVAILCGGPDWPTSVLAGVLRLSLFQCELGTVPIIGFVAPCAMSGSLYLQIDREDAIWSRSASLMIVLSVMVNMLLWAVAAWAIQNEMENNYEVLSRKLPENVDLHWLDHKHEEITKSVVITWGQVPPALRNMYVLGAASQIMICHAFWWAYNMLIGPFQVSHDISRLEWYSGTLYHSGEDIPDHEQIYLFSLATYILFAVYFLTWICYAVYSIWQKRKTSVPKKEADARLRATEAEWKEAWLKQIEEDAASREAAAREDADIEQSTSDAVRLREGADTAGGTEAEGSQPRIEDDDEASRR